jgi:NhaP-type Na+/H+ and K+/H+ antiporter
MDLDDLNRMIEAALPTEESDTLGGFIYSELGQVPVVGDQIPFDNLTFTVESVAGRRIKKVRIERHLPPAPEGEEDEKGLTLSRNGNGHGRQRPTVDRDEGQLRETKDEGVKRHERTDD